MAESWDEETLLIADVTPKPKKLPKQDKQKCLASKCEEVRQDKHRWCPNHSHLHSEACNALGASDGVIHSSISRKVCCRA